MNARPKKKASPKIHATHVTTPTGERVYVRGRTKEELSQKVLQAKIELHAGVDITSTVTFRDYAPVWLKAYKKGKVRETTYDLNESILDKHVIPFFGDAELKDIKSTHIQLFLTAIAPYSKSFQDKAFRLVRNILQAAVDDGLIVKTPVRKDDKVSADASPEEEPLSDKQARRLLEALAGTQAHTFCLLALSTGMRRGELLGLMWDDIDFEENVIHVTHNKAFPMNASDAPVTELLKTEAARRDLPMGQYLREYLLSLKAETESPYVLHMGSGESLTKSAFRAMWSAVDRRTVGKGRVPRELGASYGGVKVTLDFDVHPHLLRHTFVTKLFEEGVDLKQVQYLAGHATPEMTMRVYTHYRKKQRAKETHSQVCMAVSYLTPSREEARA
ncbi:MAG: site-specific integrase [Oscillospiraceae bacterium]|nr:site-specific integrase [Oscillospiraceae bacterium]